MTINHTSLVDIINDMENTAKIPALRAIVHSSMAKTIGSIRQDIRNRASIARNEENAGNSLDERNENDESTRSLTDIKEAMGFSTQLTPIAEASLMAAVYDWARVELNTLAVSKWDSPLTLEQMIAFMSTKAQKLDRALAEALAKAAKCDVKHIEKMHELQNQRDREQLIEATPEIIATFNGFGANGYNEAMEELPKVTQHQMGVKVVESLHKAKDNLLARVLRTRRISELGGVPIIEGAANDVSRWVEQFEKTYSIEINEALEAGRTVRTLEDLSIPA